MRKLGIFIFGALLSAAFISAEQGINTSKYVIAAAETQKKDVYVGGMSAGFSLKAGGVQIIGLCEVATTKGMCSPASNAGMRVNDKIIKICGIKIDSIAELNEILNKKNGEAVELEILRGNDFLKINVEPVKDKTTNRYKIGVLVRDNVSGIGTITYIEKETGRFGALGHSVVGEDKKELSISNGEVFECNIIGVSKGIRGKAGELRGMFLMDRNFGVAKKLCMLFEIIIYINLAYRRPD